MARLQKKSKVVQIAGNIKITEKQHATLLKYITDRLDFGKIARDAQVNRFRIIDRFIAGYIKLDKADREREIDNLLGKGPKVTDTVLPMAFSQLHEALTYIMAVIAPDEGMYSATASAEDQPAATGFSKEMNNNAITFDHFTNLMLSIFDGLKYNLGGYLVEWDEKFGPKVEIDSTNTVNINKNALLTAGNRVEWLDMYNFLYDTTVDPLRINEDGEFFAMVKLVSLFKLRKLAKAKKIFNITDLLKDSNQMSFETSYYEARPEIHIDHSGREKTTDFVKVLSMAASRSGNSIGGAEEVTIYTWLNSKELGLSESDEYQIWRLTVIDSKRIVDAVHLDNLHNMLPCAMMMPLVDGFKTQTKSFAEHLIPFQNFASFQMNIHQRAARKKLYGVTFYDSSLIDLDGFDPVATTQGTKPSSIGQGRGQVDLRQAVLQFTDAPNTDNTLRDIDVTDTLMQKVLPTDIAKQVASLDRATEYQTASVVQGASRRNYLIARTMDAQCFSKVKVMQYFNIVQFKPSFTVVDDTGETIDVSPQQVAKIELLFGLTGGLKGIDKLIIHGLLKEIVQMVLQSPRASQEIDIVLLLDYLTSVIGDYTDFSQFRFKNEFDKLSVEQKNIAFQLFQQAAQQQQDQTGGPTLPAPQSLPTNPQRV